MMMNRKTLDGNDSMEIVHIYHSGFYMELSQCALLFDYYEGTLPPIPSEKPLFVFASHVHQDHFSFSVFTKEELRAHPQATYLLSNDIKRKYNRNFFLRQGVTEAQYERITFLKAEEEICLNIDGGAEADRGAAPEWKRERGKRKPDAAEPREGQEQGGKEGAGGMQKEDCRGSCGKEPAAMGENGSGIRVRMLRSTDAGVAFLVDAGGRRIYHAGDLNWWSWEGGTEEDERTMERAYKAEIEKISGQAFDVACLPLDSRQGERFAWGFDWFMRHVEVKYAYPMHYWDDDTAIEKLLSLPCSEPYRDRIVKRRELVL